MANLRGVRLSLSIRNWWVSLNFLGGLDDQGFVDVRDNSSSGDGGLDQRVKLFVSSDRELQMSGGDSLDLQVLGGVSCKFKDLSGKILQDRSSVNGGSSSDS